jgi:hypothetical protein
LDGGGEGSRRDVGEGVGDVVGKRSSGRILSSSWGKVLLVAGGELKAAVFERVEIEDSALRRRE